MTIELGQDWKLDEYGDIAVASPSGAARRGRGPPGVLPDFGNRRMTLAGPRPAERHNGGGLAAYTDVSGSQPRMDALANIAAVDLANDDRVDPASVAVRFKRDERGVPKVYFRAAVRATGDEVTNA